MVKRPARRSRPAIRVAVLSDDPLLCAGLARILAGEPSLTFVGQPDRPLSVASVRSTRAEILLVDSRVAGMIGLCAALRREGGPALVFFMAARDDDEFAVGALEAGARGVLAVSARAEDLVKAVRVVHEGDVWARRQVMAARMEQMARASPPAAIAADVLELKLSTREREVFRHAASGMTNRELADRLGISEATVKAHLTRIFQKLGLHGRARLAAAYHGMICSESPRQPPPGRSRAQGAGVRHRQHPPHVGGTEDKNGGSSSKLLSIREKA
jgi:RNA polymerase sigma factor (sigma-70 family)